jgi:hypothetical protein
MAHFRSALLSPIEGARSLVQSHRSYTPDATDILLKNLVEVAEASVPKAATCLLQ